MLKEFFVSFPWWIKNVKNRSKIALFFKWAPFWSLISKNDNNYIFRKKIISTTQKWNNFACDNFICPKTKGNKNMQWTHFSIFNLLNCNLVFKIKGSFISNDAFFFWPWNLRNSFFIEFKDKLKTVYFMLGGMIESACWTDFQFTRKYMHK